MNNKNFDFKDLMQFGMFIISLLTFIYLICQQEIENPPSKKSWQDWVDFYYSIWPTTLSGCFLYNYNIIETYL